VYFEALKVAGLIDGAGPDLAVDTDTGKVPAMRPVTLSVGRRGGSQPWTGK